MGAGKSVLMNTADLALCMAPARAGAEPKLPRIAKLDIGFSASGLISLLRESLPPHRRHEALYKKLRQSEEIGRASCRERQCQYVYISVVSDAFHKYFILALHTLFLSYTMPTKPYNT